MMYSIILLYFILNVCSGHTSHKFEVEFEWNYVNFSWPDEETMKKFKYGPEVYIPVGIKIYEPTNTIYIALPRVKPDARITLASMPLNAEKKNPLLSPFPSLEMNSGSSCDTLQDMVSMEIDKDGIMWALDAKRTSDNVTCPAKIIQLDLKDHGKVVQSYEVPDEQCSYKNKCYLNDIVVDGDFAYCSDFTVTDPGIFIYNRKMNKSWKARNNATMYGDPKAANFTAQGVRNTQSSNINGVALSPACSKNRIFYYTPQTSFIIYSIPTAVLRNETLATGDVSSYIKEAVHKPSATGGMVCDSMGDIYFGLLPMSAVAVQKKTKSNITIIEENPDLIKWPDTFAFDTHGNLFLSATEISKFSTESFDLNAVNFRILKLFTGTRSYFYCH